MRQLLKYLNKNNIQSRPFWTPMNKLPMYKKFDYISEDDNSNYLFKKCLSIPSSSNLNREDQKIKLFMKSKNFIKK